MNKSIILVSLLLVLTVTALAGCQGKKDVTDTAVNDPTERLYDLDPQRQFIGANVDPVEFNDLITGQTFRLSDLSDKIIIFESFSVGCPACAEGLFAATCPACLLPVLGAASLTTTALRASLIIKISALVLLISSIYYVANRQQKCRISKK